MLTRLGVILIVSMLLGSCGDYAALEEIDQNKHIADSLFRLQKDTLNKSFQGVCDSVYEVQYQIALDSIKQLRLEGIKDLIEN